MHTASPHNPDKPDSIETLIIPRAQDLGGFEVRRALPCAKRQMVGPFMFFDHIGPAEFAAQKGIDIRPHPHIGLGTVTYLYEGEFEHRDSLCNHQLVYPGEINWMVAGRGITHSERTSQATRAMPHKLFGIQTWIALPKDKEDMEPYFEHHKKTSLPSFNDSGAEVRLLLGQAFGYQSPVTMHSKLFYCDAILMPHAKLPLPDDYEERAIHVVQGSVAVARQIFEPGQMLVFRPGDHISISAGERGARLMVLGGETLDGPRYIWWNFVSSSPAKIEAAKKAWQAADWEHGRFQLPPDDDKEFIPIIE